MSLRLSKEKTKTLLLIIVCLLAGIAGHWCARGELLTNATAWTFDSITNGNALKYENDSATNEEAIVIMGANRRLLLTIKRGVLTWNATPEDVVTNLIHYLRKSWRHESDGWELCGKQTDHLLEIIEQKQQKINRYEDCIRIIRNQLEKTLTSGVPYMTSSNVVPADFGTYDASTIDMKLLEKLHDGW